MQYGVFVLYFSHRSIIRKNKNICQEPEEQIPEKLESGF